MVVGASTPVASCEATSSASCSSVSNSTGQLLTSLQSDIGLPDIQFLSEPTCQSCVNAEHLEFASSGERDNERSCKKQCEDGYFRLFNLDSQVCFPHTVLTCPDGHYVRNGTRVRDAECALCSRCEGQRLLANCSRYADTHCGDCGAPKARQRWTGTACTPACDDGFVWDVRRSECEFCGTYTWEGGEEGAWRKDRVKCPPGFQTPAEPDNCTHCVPCSGLPEHASWSEQDDREDCLWLCGNEYQLKVTAAGEACVPRESVELAPALTRTEPACDPGSIPLAFTCTPCFDAAGREGSGVKLADLPEKSQEGRTWEWIFGCRWQCLHVNDFWEMQAESGLFWECKPLAERDSLLDGDDLSWLNMGARRSAAPAEAPAPESARRSMRPEDGGGGRGTLLRTAAVVGALPVGVLVCAVLLGCWRACAAGREEDSDETASLLRP